MTLRLEEVCPFVELFWTLSSVFLRRCECFDLTPDELRVGRRVAILSRLLEVVSYGDELTRVRVEGSSSDQLMLVILPDSYNATGDIICRIAMHHGTRINRILMVKLSSEQASDFYNIAVSTESIRNSSPLNDLLTSDVITVISFESALPVDSLIAKIQPSFGSDISNENWIHGSFGGERNGSGVLLSRSFNVAERHVRYFFDSNIPFKKTAIMNHCALLIVKPHAFGKAGEIIKSILSKGYEISAMESRMFELSFIEEFLDGYKTAYGGSFREICFELSSGTCLLIQVRQENVVEKLRRLCGPTDPEQARLIDPNSIRARFGENVVRNAVHCTDLEEDGILDCKLIFS
jgi:nucleoside-diphosphate kinase